ncbi:MAG: flagellar export protein FliJ [Gammaproteobacteria bacterium]|nr:flagellar export protein FliJ [Gammaproteobacteria bacterium]
MKKSVRMKPIEHLAQSREQVAIRELGSQQQHLHQQQEQLLQLETYRVEYQKQFQNKGSMGITASQFQDMQCFLNQVDKAIAQQKVQVQLASLSCEQKRELWVNAHSRTQVLETVVNRYHQEEQRELSRREQKDLDERAQRKSEHKV